MRDHMLDVHNKSSMRDNDHVKSTNEKFPLQPFDPASCHEITVGLSNSDISKFSEDQARAMLSKYAKYRGSTVPDDYMQNVPHQQLLSQLRSARDVLSKEAKLSIPKNNTTTSTLPSARELAENLRGVNSETLDPSSKNNTNSNTNTSPTDNRVPSKQMDDSQKTTSEPSSDTTIVTRVESYIHAELKTTETHVPTVVKSLIIQMRKADPSMQLLPYEVDTFLPSDIINHENDLPKEEEKFGKWIKSVETRKKRLCFSIRIATIDLDKFKTIIYAWCKKSSTWLTFVDFRAHQLCQPGWFYKICPYYYNRNNFQAYIENQEPKLKGRILIYKKELYHWDKTNGKVTTVCIVIDADIDLQPTLMKFLRNHKWGGRYADVKYVPHKTNEVYTAKHKVEMYKRQNEYASELQRSIITVKDANVPQHTKQKTTTFQDWLYSASFGEKKVILGVEVAPKNVVRILYHKDDRYDVENIITHLFEHTVKMFGAPIASTLLNEQDCSKHKHNYSEELSHSQSLIHMSENPQGGLEPSQHKKLNNRKTPLYYGSYLNVTKGEDTQTSEITQESKIVENTGGNETLEDLRKTVEAIKAQQKDMESSIMNKVDTAIENKIDPLKSEISSMRTNNESKIGQVLDELTNLQNGQATAIATAVTNAMAAFYQKTPSGRAELPPGVSP